MTQREGFLDRCIGFALGASLIMTLVGCAGDAMPSRSATPAHTRAGESPAQAVHVPPPLHPTPTTPPSDTDAALAPPSSADADDLELPAPKKPIPPKPLPTIPSSEPIVAVKIGSQPASQSVTLSSPSSTLLISTATSEAGAANSTSGATPASAGIVDAWRVRGPLEIQANKNGWSVKDARGGSSRNFAPCELVVRGVGEEPIVWNNTKWPGTLRLVVDPESGGGKREPRIDLVVDVGIEEYLPGVIAKELYANWNLETFRAQAIAARSYAVVEEDRWNGRRHWDMVAGQQSQAWAGETTNERAIEAVRSTRGQVLASDGRVVPAYYSAACGGRPASAIGTLTDNPYHDIAPVSAGRVGQRQGRCCQAASVATWKVTIPLASVRARLQAWGKLNARTDLASIEVPTAITVGDRNAAGRAVDLVVRTAHGAVEIAAEDFRWAMNAPRDRATTLKSGDIEVKVSKSAGTAEISGRGFGHGVGLCQHGAQAMAKSGASAKKILDRYYPGASIVRGWN